MPFPYKHVLLIGATSGIGAALGDKLVENGVKVIAVGRRQERLDAFVKKHGADKSSSIQFDITDAAGQKAFVEKVLKEYPDLDSVFLNSGVQRPVWLTKSRAEFNPSDLHFEMNTNFTSVVTLAMLFLPHLQAKSSSSSSTSSSHQPTSLIFTGSGLGFVPAVYMPIYSASKAALNNFIMSLRHQNRKESTKIIEIWPPAVQSELHDYMGEEQGRSFGMPMDQFVAESWKGLEAEKEFFIVGSMGTYDQDKYHGIEADRRDVFKNMSAMLTKKFEGEDA